jgi:phosphate transport system substrate-binding protein
MHDAALTARACHDRGRAISLSSTCHIGPPRVLASLQASQEAFPCPSSILRRATAAAALVVVAAAPAFAQDVTGAGASFPAPVYSKWADRLQQGHRRPHQLPVVGSGAGIRQIKAKTVDFGASDAPLKDDELAKDGMIQFPTVIGGVVPVINVKGIAPGS